MADKLPSVLVTGATGLVGSRLLRVLEGRWDVYALARTAASVASLPKERQVVVDLAGDWDESALPARLDAVVHLAQADDYRRFPEGAAGMRRVNVEGAARLLEHARVSGARAFVLASSGGVCGGGDAPLTEEAPVKLAVEGPIAYYLRTKRVAELLAEPYGTAMAVSILRFFFVYGSGQKKPMLFPRLIENVREGRPIDLAGDDGIRINPIHADDAARAVSAALDLQRSSLIHVAGPEIQSLRRVCETIGSVVGRAPVFRVDGASRPQDIVVDISLMKQTLGAPRIGIDEGLKEMAQ